MRKTLNEAADEWLEKERTRKKLKRQTKFKKFNKKRANIVKKLEHISKAFDEPSESKKKKSCKRKKKKQQEYVIVGGKAYLKGVTTPPKRHKKKKKHKHKKTQGQSYHDFLNDIL